MLPARLVKYTSSIIIKVLEKKHFFAKLQIK